MKNTASKITSARIKVETPKAKSNRRFGHLDVSHTQAPTPAKAALMNQKGTMRNEEDSLALFDDKRFSLKMWPTKIAITHSQQLFRYENAREITNDTSTIESSQFFNNFRSIQHRFSYRSQIVSAAPTFNMWLFLEGSILAELTPLTRYSLAESLSNFKSASMVRLTETRPSQIIGFHKIHQNSIKPTKNGSTFCKNHQQGLQS
jgi:hypothetical protein